MKRFTSLMNKLIGVGEIRKQKSPPPLSKAQGRCQPTLYLQFVLILHTVESTNLGGICGILNLNKMFNEGESQGFYVFRVIF